MYMFIYLLKFGKFSALFSLSSLSETSIMLILVCLMVFYKSFRHSFCSSGLIIFILPIFKFADSFY